MYVSFNELEHDCIGNGEICYCGNVKSLLLAFLNTLDRDDKRTSKGYSAIAQSEVTIANKVACVALDVVAISDNGEYYPIDVEKGGWGTATSF